MPFDGDDVGLPVAATGRAGQVDVGRRKSVPDMSSTVTVSVPPSAVRSSRSTLSMSMRMLATSRRNSERPPFGRQAHVLGGAGAVEVERVDAAGALDDVAAVARVPAEAVVARAELAGVVAAVAVDGVVAAAAEEQLGAVAAVHDVVAAAAVDGEWPRRRRRR